jgi:hypothetical protein
LPYPNPPGIVPQPPLNTPHRLVEMLRRQIDSAQLPREKVRETLQFLLNDYA